MLINRVILLHSSIIFFFFNDTATTEIYTLSLHDALPIFIAIARPRPWAMPRRDLLDAATLGLVSAGMTLLFFEAIARIPLATAVACEFLGPLTVAVARRSGRLGLVWPA